MKRHSVDGVTYDPLERCQISGNADANGHLWCEACGHCGNELGQHRGTQADCGLAAPGRVFLSLKVPLYWHADDSLRPHPPAPPGVLITIPLNASERRLIPLNAPERRLIPSLCSGCSTPNEWQAEANAGIKWYCGQCRMMKSVFG